MGLTIGSEGLSEENSINNGTIDGSPIGVTTPSTGNFTSVSATSLNVAGDILAAANRITVSAATITAKLTGATASYSGMVSADGGIRTTIVSADTINTGVFRTATPVIVSAAGTTQATASLISSSVGITRLAGVTDGQTTGFLLPAPGANIGIQQFIVNEGISANLWPSIGCAINGAAANAVFPMVTKTPYLVAYITTSAYSVK